MFVMSGCFEFTWLPRIEIWLEKLIHTIAPNLKISVIFTTYYAPAWLEKVLWGFENQAEPDFEVIIADDGSTEETGALVQRFIEESPLQLKHVWQPDKGFRKCSSDGEQDMQLSNGDVPEPTASRHY
jgi:hypothetical protein